jgi:hypothetical protein
MNGWNGRRTEEHRHHLSRHPSVKNISPAPNAERDEDRICRASGLGGGAMHCAECFADEVEGWGEARVRFASGTSAKLVGDTGRGRLVPALALVVVPFSPSSSTLIMVSSPSRESNTFQLSSPPPFRMAIKTPGVPAYRVTVGIEEAHDAQMNVSYAEAEIKGGGRPEEEVEVIERVSSLSSSSSVASVGSVV